jgi:RNA polymerase sigma-70 factor (ECF subfamily)
MASAFAPPIDWATELAAHDRWLRLVVRARLGDRQAVDEVMQELALAVVAARAPLADRSRLPAWLYRLAVRQVLIFRRRIGRQRKLLGRFAEHQAGGASHDEQPDPLHWLVRAERVELVRAALDRLPPRDAEILMLKYGENLSSRDLAQRLGVSVSAVEARLCRVREKLRSRLSRTLFPDSKPCPVETMP